MNELNPATKLALELLYRTLLSAVVQLAVVLGKECPVITRTKRRQMREGVVQ
jgi:hypothetical protein